MLMSEHIRTAATRRGCNGRTWLSEMRVVLPNGMNTLRAEDKGNVSVVSQAAVCGCLHTYIRT
jgi:hypothetical protein